MLVSNYHTCYCWWLLDMLAIVAIFHTSFRFYSVVFYDAFYSLLPAVCCLLIFSEIPLTLLSGYLIIPHQGPKLWRLVDSLIRMWSFFPFSHMDLLRRCWLKTANVWEMNIQSLCVGVSDWHVLRMTGQFHSYRQMVLLTWWHTGWAPRYINTPTTKVTIAYSNWWRLWI
jgi:hypothetical protein